MITIHSRFGPESRVPAQLSFSLSATQLRKSMADEHLNQIELAVQLWNDQTCRVFQYHHIADRFSMLRSMDYLIVHLDCMQCTFVTNRASGDRFFTRSDKHGYARVKGCKIIAFGMSYLGHFAHVLGMPTRTIEVEELKGADHAYMGYDERGKPWCTLHEVTWNREFAFWIDRLPIRGLHGPALGLGL